MLDLLGWGLDWVEKCEQRCKIIKNRNFFKEIFSVLNRDILKINITKIKLSLGPT